MSVSADTAELFIPDTQNRALALCLAVSLALHALLLLLPGLRPGASTPAATKVLTATFAPRAIPSEPAAATAEVQRRREALEAKPEKTSRPESFRPARAAPSAATTGSPDLSDLSSAPTVQFAAAALAPSASDGTARQLEAQPAAKASGAGSARAGDEADAGTLDRYRLALIVAAKRYKRYPAQAMDKGWQGRVEVRLVIGANGAIQAGIVRASSGYEILDSQALDMVKNAKPLAPIPAALRGREFTVDIPVIFDLQAG